MNKVFLSLGANLGNRQANLSAAIKKISKNLGNITLLSKVYETEAWGFESENNFLNQVILIETNLEPIQLIHSCLDVEKKMGRERKIGANYESRVIDIDILFYNKMIIADDNLQIPHPQLHNRRFILEPLNEIAPNFIHPVLDKSVSTLLAECCDNSGCIIC